MLLIDQVDLLRNNLPQVKSMKGVLPILGGPKHTQQAYNFVHLVHPARDIISTIHAADKSGATLPHHLRGWNIDVKDGNGNTLRTHLKRILGMIIHMNYLRFADELDVTNDSNDRVIVSREVFINELQRLLLNHDDICLVACARAREACGRKTSGGKAISITNADSAELRDLQRILWDISSMPELLEVVWKAHFHKSRKQIARKSKTVNNHPFVKGGRSTRSGLTLRIGWRRDDSYSDAWVDIIALTTTIREHIQNI